MARNGNSGEGEVMRQSSNCHNFVWWSLGLNDHNCGVAGPNSVAEVIVMCGGENNG